MTDRKTSRLISEDADELQKELHKNFPSSHFLSNPINCDHFLRWNTFFRRNYNRFATDFLGLALYDYQAMTLYEMGINNMIVIVACRAAAKSFIIALYCCIRCILYPGTKILLSSATKGQSELIVTEKIKNELMEWSPMLAREIESIKDNQNKTIVYFRNKSKIVVVVANDNARGNRSNCIVREEFARISSSIDGSVLSPCQILRQPMYMKNDYYKNIPGLKEEPVDIYITSSCLDNGNWMWTIVDNAYNQMCEGKPSCLLAFDEAVVLKHEIKSMRQLVSEKRKQDPITWKLEFMNCRLSENQSAFFTYGLMQKNQKCKQPFYPRLDTDVRIGKKNPYQIPKQQGEIRIVSCDMAFITNDKNDNSVFSCLRLLPEKKVYAMDSGAEGEISSGYHIIVPYMTAVQGGDTDLQALTIRRLFDDFQADYLVLDLRNAGISIYDKIAKVMFDDIRRCEYPPLCAINSDEIANRIKVEGANPCVYVISATQKLNSDIAINFRRYLAEEMIDILIPYNQAVEEVFPQIKEYGATDDADSLLFYETPFLETQDLISETVNLTYEKKEQTGAIVIREQGMARKDRYSSISYGCWVANLLAMDLLAESSDYDYCVFVD